MHASRYARRLVGVTAAAPVPFAVVLIVVATAAAALLAVLSGCQGPGGSPSAGKTPSGPRAAARNARPGRRCGTADLSVAATSRTTKQGLDIARFAVTTTAAGGCTLAGAPNLRPKGPLSPQTPGATVDLAVSQQPVPQDVGLQAGDGGPVQLLPGGSASFYLAWYSTSPVVCVQSNGFGFDAPGDTAYADMKPVGYPVGPVCDGVFYVSPVF